MLSHSAFQNPVEDRILGYSNCVQNRCQHGRGINEQHKPDLTVTQNAQEDHDGLHHHHKDGVFHSYVFHPAADQNGKREILLAAGLNHGIRVLGFMADPKSAPCHIHRRFR